MLAAAVGGSFLARRPVVIHKAAQIVETAEEEWRWQYSMNGGPWIDMNNDAMRTVLWTTDGPMTESDTFRRSDGI